MTTADSQICIHTKDGHRVGLTELAAVPIPEKTRSYCPVPNIELVDFVRSRVTDFLGLEIESEAYGLSRKDQQMFGVMRVDTGRKDHGLSIGLRNSYDKSLLAGLATGAGIFVCDNLCFSGDSGTYFRKHTTNVWRDIRLNVDKALRDAGLHYERMTFDLDAMKTIPLSGDQGYELIGRALGHSILMPQQATVAMRDWDEPRHEEFAPRNLHSLYNCFTEGLKKGPAGTSLDRHSAAHDWFRPMLPAPPVTVAIG